jgi:hypothetical protein
MNKVDKKQVIINNNKVQSVSNILINDMIFEFYNINNFKKLTRIKNKNMFGFKLFLLYN